MLSRTGLNLRIAAFSTTNADINSSDTKIINVYKGFFASNLKWLKRFSIGSSAACMVGLPLLLITSTAAIAFGGKVAIAGTALVTSVSSTCMLQYCTSPYIVSLDEVVNTVDAIAERPNRKLIATRLNFLGLSKKTEFNLDDVELLTKNVHPFATFKLKSNDTLFFVYGKMLEDVELRLRLTGLGEVL
jgi:hypothetical protein